MPMLADDLVACTDGQLNGPGKWQDEWGAQQPPGPALPQPDCHGCPPASAAWPAGKCILTVSSGCIIDTGTLL